jgi:hypothetical protein
MRLLRIAVLFGLLPGCGSSSSSTPEQDSAASTPTKSYVVDEVYLSLLQVDDPETRDGSPQNSATVQANHPLRLKYGLTQTGKPSQMHVSFGLMEQLPAGATDEQRGALRTCFLGSDIASHSGGGREQTFDVEFIVPPECVPADQPIKYNLYFAADVPGEVTEAGEDSEEYGNVYIYNEELAGDARNVLCKRLDGTPGCIFDITAEPSPGLNLVLDAFATESSVALLTPKEEHPDAVDESGNPKDEAHPAFAEAKLTFSLHGAAPGTENPLGETGARIHFQVCPEVAPDDSCVGGAWKDLTVLGTGTENEHTGHAPHLTIASMRGGDPTHVTAMLYAEGETHEALVPGGVWGGYADFVIRACLQTDLDEKHGDFDDVIDHVADNCKLQVVRLADLREPPAPTEGLALIEDSSSSYSMTQSWDQSYGDNSTVGVEAKFETGNTLNLSGASSATSGDVKLKGWLATSVAHAHAKGAAYVSLTGSFVDIQQTIFGNTLFSYGAAVPEELVYEKNWSITKEQCVTFSYGVLVLSLDVSVCAGGSGGFDSSLTVRAAEGAAAPFSSAQRVGKVIVAFTPKASFNTTAAAYASVELARAGVEGTLQLLELGLPTTGSLTWGLTSLSPPVLDIVGNVNMKLNINTMNGNLQLFADTREVKICQKRWKVFGRRFSISYPCGFNWDREVELNLASWRGARFAFNLLDRSKTVTLR